MITNYDKYYKGNQQGAWENPTFDRRLRKVSLLFVVRCMDLESLIQSEVNQKEKNKYHMLTPIYGI